MKFSIITPVLNGESYIEKCIESTLKQKYSNIEHIFVDGGSNDNTIKIINKYKEKFPAKIRLEEKKGRVGYAWNHGILLAEGEIFGWLGADDQFYDCETIQLVADFLKENTFVDIVRGLCEYVDEFDQHLGNSKMGNADLNHLLNIGNPIACPSTFYTRKLINEIGLLDQYGNDLEYWIRISKKFQIYEINKNLSKFRIHKLSETGNPITKIRARKMDMEATKKHGAHIFSMYRIRYYVALIYGSLFFLKLKIRKIFKY